MARLRLLPDKPPPWLPAGRDMLHHAKASRRGRGEQMSSPKTKRNEPSTHYARAHGPICAQNSSTAHACPLCLIYECALCHGRMVYMSCSLFLYLVLPCVLYDGSSFRGRFSISNSIFRSHNIVLPLLGVIYEYVPIVSIMSCQLSFPVGRLQNKDNVADGWRFWTRQRFVLQLVQAFDAVALLPPNIEAQRYMHAGKHATGAACFWK
jgi:hypothetical protein